MRERRINHAIGLAVLVAAVGACSTVPPPITDPGIRSPVGAAMTWSGDWGYARAHIRRPDGTIQALSGNGDDTYGTNDPGATELSPLLPAAVSAHFVQGEWDAGGYTGWRRFGGTLRRRLIVTDNGATTSLALAGNVHWSFRGEDLSAAAEQTVPLPLSMRLILRLGASYGLRDYDIIVPRDLDTTYGHDNTIGQAHFDLLRTDARLEPAIGLIFWRQLFVLSFQPYFVVAHGAYDQARCADCAAGVALQDFTLSRGFALALTVRSP